MAVRCSALLDHVSLSTDILDKLWLDPNRMLAVIIGLRTIVPDIQLQATVIIKPVYAQNLANTPTKNQPRLVRHLLLNRRRHSQHPHSVSDFERRFGHDVRSGLTFRLTGPAPVTAAIQPRRNRGVRCSRFVMAFSSQSRTIHPGAENSTNAPKRSYPRRKPRESDS